ncbi:unnamed protein product [Auanema sp. JU1783]|nr:unnamed protein product [Auanema sp. JU1783]
MANTTILPNCIVITANPEPYQHFAQIVNGWMTTICVVLGSSFNIHGIHSVIMNADKNRGVVLGVSMVFLGLWDTVLLWCAFFYYGIKHMPFGFVSTEMLNHLTPWFHAFSQIANTASIWCVVAITLQRFMATRDPFRSSRSPAFAHSFRSERRISFISCSTYRRLLRMPFILSLCAIIINVPAFFEIIAAPCFSRVHNKKSVHLIVTPFRRDAMYKMYRLLSRMILISIGPNIFILCVTLITIYILKGSNRSRRQLFQMSDMLIERHASRETTQTWISIILVFKFLLLRSLTFALDIMEMTIGVTNFFVVDISNFLLILNSATNCILFLKAKQWMDNRWHEKKTIKRKKTLCDASLLQGERAAILHKTWQNALRMTNSQLGLRVLYSMLRKHPALFNVFRMPNQTIYSTDKCPVEPELVSLLTNGQRRSFDIITNTKYQEVADRITTFITEMIDLMMRGQPEEYVVMRVRRIGAIHYDKGIHFSSSVWKEFKNSTISIIAECDFDSQAERDAAMDAWNIFTSFIIREMKMGTWAIGETLGTMP